MKKIICVLMSLLLAVFVFTSCTEQTPLDPNDPITLNMWHNYGGDMQEAMDMLIDKFNGSIGKEQGIIINVTAISSSSELNKSLDMIVNGDPGAPEMPDIFTGYPKIAIKFAEKGLLADFSDYFSEDETGLYIDKFIEEGKIDGKLYVFPIAKSTEVLYVNQTLFDRFAAETGVSADELSTVEGLISLSQKYYEYSGGKQFFASDSWFNFAQVGTYQSGGNIFADESLDLSDKSFKYFTESVYEPAVKGGFAIYDGYSSDLSKTGEIVCSIGSSAGILFYGDTITYEDGSIEQVEYNILPYPYFENGTKTALQRGGGLMLKKSDEKREYAAYVFIKWLTSPEQNIEFVSQTGYLPVTKHAFENSLPELIKDIDDMRIKKMLTSVLTMYENYSFFYSPVYADSEADSAEFEAKFKQLLNNERAQYLESKETSFENFFAELIK